jgi:IS4 transposase
LGAISDAHLEIHSSIPVFIAITEGRIHDVNLLDALVPEPGSFIVMDRGYIDFARLYRLQLALTFFVIRAKDNLRFARRYSHPHDRATGVRSDQTIVLTGPKTATLYPVALRRVAYYSSETGQRLVFLTNNFAVPALTVAGLYRYRWQVELFFKWIKQHLRIKRFFGTSENSVKTQIWTAVAVYVLVAIVKKRLGLEHDLYTILQILSLTLFEKTPILSLFQHLDDDFDSADNVNQLKLLDI